MIADIVGTARENLMDKSYGMMNRKPVALAISALFAGVLGAGHAAAGGIGLYEVGTEEVGLASAGYAARAQDASTVFTNPAGMTRLQGDQFQIGQQLLYSNLKFSIDGATTPALGTNDGGHILGKNGFLPGGGFFYSHSVSPDLKVGFASASNFGAAVKYNDGWAGRYYGQQAAMVGMSLMPSVAYKVTDQFSVGANVNAMYGYMKQVVGINNIVGPDGKLVLRDTTWGVGGNVGMLYEPSPNTRFGLTYASRVKLDFSAPANFQSLGPGLNALLAARGLLNSTIKMDIHGSFPEEMASKNTPRRPQSARLPEHRCGCRTGRPNPKN